MIDVGPADTNATVDYIVPCDCRYTGTEDLPLWRINGDIHSPNALPPGYMANKTGLYTYFRSFQEMNMPTYQCLFKLYIDAFQIVEQNSTVGTVFMMQGQLLTL